MPDMNFPLKNKEQLDLKDTLVVSKLKYKIAIWTAAFSFLGLVVTGGFPVMQGWLTSEDRIMRKEVERQQYVNSVLDSVKAANGKRAVKQTFENIGRIYEIMTNLQRDLPDAASIAIYSTHDSGGVPRSGTPLRFTILYESGNKQMKTGKAYWQNRIMPEGYFNMAKRTYEQGEVYYDVLKDHPEMYQGEAKEDLEFDNIGSFYSKLIKATPTSIFYIAVLYEGENPIRNRPNLKNIIRVASYRLDRLIQTNAAL